MRAGRAGVLLPAAIALAALACEPFRARSEGERLWSRHCAGCHGVDAAGNTPRFMGNVWADLTDDTWRTSGDEYAIQSVVREGVFGEMPANPKLTEAELRAVVDWLYRLRGETR
jgi:mono/diheme cytochrome c family protein